MLTSIIIEDTYNNWMNNLYSYDGCRTDMFPHQFDVQYTFNQQMFKFELMEREEKQTIDSPISHLNK